MVQNRSRGAVAREQQPGLNPAAGDTLLAAPGRRYGVAQLVRQVIRPTELPLVFLTSLTVNLVMVYFVVFKFNLFLTDSMSRTLHAWQVFFSAQPKLAAIGFIWAPLPTILQLPFVLIPPLRDNGLSGNVLTALMGATSAVFLVLILRRFGLPRWYRWAVIAVWSVNPMILFYSSNGMSEMTFMAFTIASIYFLLVWYQTGRHSAIMLMGASVGLAFLARYDTFFHAAGLFVALLILARRRRASLPEAEGVTITYLLPVVFAAGSWVAANLTIMGDPLHFARGEYSNAAQIDYQLELLPYLLTLIGRPDRIALFMLNQIVALFPVFLAGFVLLLGDFLATRNRLSLCLAFLALSFPLFQALNFYTGQTAAFLRYFILAIPWGIVMLSYFLSRIRIAPGAVRLSAGAAIIALMLVSSVSSGAAMVQAADWGQWNDRFMSALLTGERIDTWRDEREIAQWIEQRVQGREVLVDDFQGYRIIFYTGKPWLFISNADNDFAATLKEPIGRAKYVLVSSTRLEGALNQVNKQHPTLYESGAEWAVLEGSWPQAAGVGWKLYRILEPADVRP